MTPKLWPYPNVLSWSMPSLSSISFSSSAISLHFAPGLVNNKVLRSYVHYICRAANDPSVFTITEMAPTRAFFWLKVPTCLLVLSHLRH